MKNVFSKTVGLIMCAAMLLAVFPANGYAQETGAGEVMTLTETGAEAGENTDLQEGGAYVTLDEAASGEGDMMDLLQDGNAEQAVYNDEDPVSSVPTDSDDQQDLLTEEPQISEEESIDENTPVADSIKDNAVSDNDITDDTLSDDEEITNDGYFYPDEKDGPHITFVGRNNGKYKTIRFKNSTNVVGGVAVQAFLNTLGSYNNIVNGMTDEEGTLFDSYKDEYIQGWKVTVDGVEDTVLESDFTYSDTGKDYLVQKGKDYYFTAVGGKDGPGSFYIQSVPAVIYNGKEHVITDEKLSKSDLKKKSADLYVLVVQGADILKPGTDYTVKYKNNKEASLKMDDNNNGIFEQKYTDPSKRPSVTVTGKGKYAGFTATAYFDIYPYNFGKEKSHVQISGLANAYTLKDGEVQGKIAPKITLALEGMKEVTLKDGRDYEIVLYKGDKSGSGQWLFCPKGNTQNLVSAGQYMFAVRGKGNYCGVYCGQADARNLSLNPAYPFICENYTESFAPWQFRLTDETIYDLADMRINIGKPVLKHSIDKKVYTADDFQISVSYKKGKKWESVPKDCYNVVFTSKEYPYIRSFTSDNIPNIDYTNSSFSPYTSEGRVAMAGSYTVTVKAKSFNSLGLTGTLTGKNKVKLSGITPKNKQLKQRTLKYDGTNDFGPVYVTAGLPYDLIVDAKSALNYHINAGDDSEFPSSKLALYHRYVGEDIGAKVVYPYKPADDRMPGTYTAEFIPVGSAIDHDKVLKTTYKRVGISLKEAENKKNPETGQPLFEVNMTGADNTLNVNGTMPDKLTIYFNGGINVINSSSLQYNGAKVTLIDQYQNQIEVKVRAYNNKEVGQGYIEIEGDNKVFKGKSSRYYFMINEKPVSSSILVINPDKYSYGANGVLYASMKPVYRDYKDLTIPTTKPDITLYQAYYKNEKDYNAHRLSYGKVDKKFYKLNFVLQDTMHFNYFKVEVKDGTKKGFTFTSVNLNQNYTLYWKKADITDIEVEYEGMTYYLPDPKLSFGFTGGPVRPTVKRVRVNGEYVTNNDYIVTYGENLGAGKNKGSITITMVRNNSTGEFKRYGSKTFYFNISKPAAGVTL